MSYEVRKLKIPPSSCFNSIFQEFKVGKIIHFEVPDVNPDNVAGLKIGTHFDSNPVILMFGGYKTTW